VTLRVVAALLLTLAGALWLRLLPARAGVVGGDAWFYLLWADALRRQRRLCARLSCYLLDVDAQWYPPLFGVLLAALPAGLRQRRASWLAPIIDVVHLGLLCLTAMVLGVPPLGVWVSALVYAVTPVLTQEYSTLGARSTASLLLSIFTVTTLLAGSSPGFGWAICAVLAGALLLLTHKMAAQLWVVVLPALIALGTDARVVLTIAALAVAGAFLLSGGFYRQVFAGHVAALRFWREHALELNAHPIYDSPLFRGPLRPEWQHSPYRRRMYRPGLSGQVRLLRLLFGLNPWWVLLPLLWTQAPLQDALSRGLLAWATAGVGVAFLTTFVSPLRFLGPGPRYLKFTAFPLAVLIGRAWGQPDGLTWLAPLLLVCAAAYWKLHTQGELEQHSEAFAQVVAFVKAHPARRLAALPSSRCDALAFLAGKDVLWGLHSAGYDKLADVHPVLRKSLPALFEQYEIELLVVDTGFVDPQDLGLQTLMAPCFTSGRFTVFQRRYASEGVS
jgi:hypothetical protein